MTLEHAGNKQTRRHLLSETTRLARFAHEMQGKEAFAQSRASAAVHEAGHAVVGTICCEIVSRIEVWRNADDERSWGGVTEYTRNEWMASDARTTPTADFKNAIVTFAGVASEMLFDTDYRFGSSLDEIVMFNSLCSNAAHKLRLSDARFQQTAEGLQRVVLGMLQRYEPVVREIAAELMARDELRYAELAKLLEPVAPDQSFEQS